MNRRDKGAYKFLREKSPAYAFALNDARNKLLNILTPTNLARGHIVLDIINPIKEQLNKML